MKPLFPSFNTTNSAARSPVKQDGKNLPQYTENEKVDAVTRLILSLPPATRSAVKRLVGVQRPLSAASPPEAPKFGGPVSTVHGLFLRLFGGSRQRIQNRADAEFFADLSGYELHDISPTNPAHFPEDSPSKGN